MDIKKLLSEMTLEEKLGQIFMLDFRRWKNRGESAQSDHQEFSPEVKEIIAKYFWTLKSKNELIKVLSVYINEIDKKIPKDLLDKCKFESEVNADG